MVIIDSPPAGVVTDPTILAARVDATLLIVEPKRTKLRAAMQAVEQLQRANANLVGLVFNNVPLRHAGYYSGYEKGYYYYQYAEYYEGGGNGKRPGLLGKRGRSKKKES
jgi:tyrosine-protein kinase Etk/Wzc